MNSNVGPSVCLQPFDGLIDSCDIHVPQRMMSLCDFSSSTTMRMTVVVFREMS